MRHKQSLIAVFAVLSIALHLALRFAGVGTDEAHNVPMSDLPLLACLALGGIPLVWDLLVKVRHAEFGSDILAGISIVCAALCV